MKVTWKSPFPGDFRVMLLHGLTPNEMESNTSNGLSHVRFIVFCGNHKLVAGKNEVLEGTGENLQPDRASTSARERTLHIALHYPTRRVQVYPHRSLLAEQQVEGDTHHLILERSSGQIPQQTSYRFQTDHFV